MKFIASRLSDGNKIFPPEIDCEEHGLTVKIPGLFNGKSEFFDYNQISSVGVDTPLIGYSTITFYASSNFIRAHGFTKSEVKQIKSRILLGKAANIHAPKFPTTTEHPPNHVLTQYPNSEIITNKVIKKVDSLDDKILSLIKDGQRAQAVKLCKDETGMDLAEAKEYVDLLATEKSESVTLVQNAVKIFQVKDTRKKEIQKEYPRINLAPDDSDIFEHLVRKEIDLANQLTIARYPNMKGKKGNGPQAIFTILIDSSPVLNSSDHHKQN